MKKPVLISLCVACVLLAFFAAGCGMTAAVSVTPPPEPTVEPTPTPTPEPVLPEGYLVTADGTKLESGSFLMGDTACVSLQEFADAVGVELTEENGSCSFEWRGGKVMLKTDSTTLYRDDKELLLDCAPFAFHGGVCVPVESLCEALEISLYYDEEYSHMYCTPGAGNWELKTGYKVPVFMYHCVSNNADADLYVHTGDMEAQIQYLVDNGYAPIWFEDLEHVEDYDKPVILTYDDGYENNYTDLFPLVQKYKVKVSICVITSYIDAPGYLSSKQITEMVDSGLVAIESHTVDHLYLNELGTGWQDSEMRDSELAIVRLTGKEPVMICYPTGCSNSITYEMTAKYYRFGMKMTGPCYVTGDDPTQVWRIFVKGSDGLTGFVNRLNKALEQ